MLAYYAQVISPINIGGEKIEFEEEAEHVGILRSIHGNLAHILNHFTAHRRSLAAVLPIGLARGHRGNPAASIRIHQIYSTPVLFSGLSSLVLNPSEIDMIDMFLKVSLQNLQKLMDKTPACVVAFLGGSLPGTALLHMRQLNMFGMITRLPGSVLNIHGTRILISAKSSATSWFQQICDLCLQYHLPHPLSLLEQPLTKLKFNQSVKSKVVDYWEIKLRAKASSLTSAPFFNPAFMSLTRPHPIWTACGSNPFECHKAVITSRMLSGRYLTDRLQRHWTQNKSGKCLLPNCLPAAEGSLEHLLLFCPALSTTRSKLLSLCAKTATEDDKLSEIINWSERVACDQRFS